MLAKGCEPNKLTCQPREERLSGRQNNVTYELKQQEELSLHKISTLLTLMLNLLSQTEAQMGSEPKVHSESSLLPPSYLLLPSTKWQISTTLDCGWAIAKPKYVSFSVSLK